VVKSPRRDPRSIDSTPVVLRGAHHFSPISTWSNHTLAISLVLRRNGKRQEPRQPPQLQLLRSEENGVLVLSLYNLFFI
jgi:hypothetical protein